MRVPVSMGRKGGRGPRVGGHGAFLIYAVGRRVWASVGAGPQLDAPGSCPSETRYDRELVALLVQYSFADPTVTACMLERGSYEQEWLS